MRKFCLFLMLFTSIPLFAQWSYKNGYIVTLSQDTVLGKICKQNNNNIFCKFKTFNDETVDYQPNDIAAFGYSSGNTYISKKIDENVIFVKYLVKGNLNLYSLKYGKNNRYFVENETDSLSEIKLEYETFKGATGMTLHKLTNRHIELLTKYTANTSSLQRKIKHIDLLEESNLIAIAEKYNKTVCGTTKCNSECCKVFRNDNHKFDFELNPVFGFNAFATKDLTFTAGITGYFKLPKCDNKLFVKTGFLYSKITEVKKITKQKGFVQIPIQIEARYPIKYFRPKAALGVCLSSLKYFDDFYTTMISIGTDVFLTKDIYFSLNYDINFEPLFLILPLRLSSNSLLFGINFVF